MVGLPGLRTSVRTKLVVPITLAVLGIGLANAAFLQRSTRASLEHELDRRALALASELALRATHRIVVEDVGGLQAVVDDVASRDDVVYAVVIGSSGFAAADSFSGGIPGDLIRVFEQPRDGLDKAVSFRTDQGLVNDYVAQMIDGRMGTVHLGISRERVGDVAATQARMALFVAVGTALVAAALAITVAHLVTGPLRELNHAAGRIGDGDLDVRTAVDSGDEVGELARAFDRMADRLQRDQVALQAAHRAMLRTERLATLGKVAAGVAHEIGNPLHAARQFVEALKDRGQPSQQRYLELLDEALDRMDRVIRQMVEYSAERRIAPREVDVNDVIDRSTRFLQLDRRASGVRLDEDLRRPLPPVVVDPDALGQVLVNLLVNALDAVEGEGWIRVASEYRVEDDEPWVVVSVCDDGPGIAEALRERVFEPFYTSKEVGSGTGLGLSMSQELTEAMGGRLELLPSSRGVGATFEVQLPGTGG